MIDVAQARSRILWPVLATTVLVAAGEPIQAATIGPDVYGYTVTDQVPFEYIDISGFGTKVMASFSEGFAIAGMPFDFNFYGTNYRRTRVSVNGAVFFGEQGVNDSFNIPLNDPAATGNLPSLYPLWDDLANQPNTPQATYITTIGTPGSRQHVMQWISSHWLGSTTNSVQFEVVLYEGSNDIQINYLDVGFGASSFNNGASATVGLRNPSGELTGEFLQWSHNRPVLRDQMSLRIHREVPGPRETLVPAGANWKYWDLGGNQGTQWRDPDFDDSNWANGPAQLGYGDQDEDTVIRGGDTFFRPTTNYFRHEFMLDDAESIQSLALSLLRDDGAAVYLNGFEIGRDRLIDAAVFSDYAMGASVEGIDESRYYVFNANPRLLRNGRNVLAVEILELRSAAHGDQISGPRAGVAEPAGLGTSVCPIDQAFFSFSSSALISAISFSNRATSAWSSICFLAPASCCCDLLRRVRSTSIRFFAFLSNERSSKTPWFRTHSGIADCGATAAH
jgi:hypothetical protein